MTENSFIVKGDFVYSDADRSLITCEDQYLVCVNGISKGIFAEIPDKYLGLELHDYSGRLVIPGMTDLHVHAPQYTFRGLGMDLELLEWLQTYTFPEEGKYHNLEYAKAAYQIFTDDLKRSYTTRACVFATVHSEATMELMNQLEETGLITYVGKVNMDRNGTPELCDVPLPTVLQEMEDWINASRSGYQRTFPILTPRFIPSCSDELMKELGEMHISHKLRIQSHLSENPDEIAWVRELVPVAESYGQAYELFGMIGSPQLPAIMAHCVYSDERERSLLKEHGVYIAHCPDSNLNIASGIAPVRTFLNEGIHVGIGTDVAGGANLSMPRAVTLAIQSSKMYWRLVDNSQEFLSFADAFYLATIGGGSYFGKVGSFAEGYEADLLVVDDSDLKSMSVLSPASRAERLMYFSENCTIRCKYVAGRKIFD